MPETWKEIKTRLLANPEQPRSYEAVKGGSSPSCQIQAKLRIEGETKEDLNAIALLLRQTFDVLSESQDYPNRGGYGIRRYLTIRIASYQSISIP